MIINNKKKTQEVKEMANEKEATEMAMAGLTGKMKVNSSNNYLFNDLDN